MDYYNPRRLPLYLLEADDFRQDIAIRKLAEGGRCSSAHYWSTAQQRLGIDAWRRQHREAARLEAAAEPLRWLAVANTTREEEEKAASRLEDLLSRAYNSRRRKYGARVSKSLQRFLDTATRYPEESCQQWAARLGTSLNNIHKMCERVRRAAGLRE